MAEKLRYSDEELEEFRAVINAKLELAKRDYDQMMRSLRNEDGNDVADTSPTYKGLEDGSYTSSRRAHAACTASGKVHSGTSGGNYPHREQDLRYLSRDRKAHRKRAFDGCSPCNIEY